MVSACNLKLELSLPIISMIHVAEGTHGYWQRCPVHAHVQRELWGLLPVSTWGLEGLSMWNARMQDVSFLCSCTLCACWLGLVHLQRPVLP